jgi:type IV secretory pathway VirB10-like protein
MNTFWLKIAGVVVGIVVIVVLIGVFTSSSPSETPEPKSEPPAKTIYEQWDRDDKRLRAEPQPIEQPNAVSPSQPPAVEQRQPQFKALSPEEEIEAQQKWEWVVTQRKMARLPVMGYKQMVDTCREIIQRWPKSKYAFLAKRALADLPEKYQTMYDITKEETDLSGFYR